MGSEAKANEEDGVMASSNKEANEEVSKSDFTPDVPSLAPPSAGPVAEEGVRQQRTFAGLMNNLTNRSSAPSSSAVASGESQGSRRKWDFASWTGSRAGEPTDSQVVPKRGD